MNENPGIENYLKANEFSDPRFEGITENSLKLLPRKNAYFNMIAQIFAALKRSDELGEISRESLDALMNFPDEVKIELISMTDQMAVYKKYSDGKIVDTPTLIIRIKEKIGSGKKAEQ